jgi:Gpi18-like mannosyltransferase
MKLKLILANQWKQFLALNIWIKLIILAIIIIGSVARIMYISNLGFKYDTGLFYVWGTEGLNMGYYDFWKNYSATFDYVPGSLYFLIGIKIIARLFSDNYETFMIVLKSVNWIGDIFLVFTTYYIARAYGKFSYGKSVLISLFSYILPSLWFVTALWGQLDTILVLLCLYPVIFMFKSVESGEKFSWKYFYKNYSFWSGVIFALAFWFKLQAILIIPAMVLFALSYKGIFKAKPQLWGFLITTLLIIFIPLITNIRRLGEVMGAPFIRSDNVSDGASTFWIALGMNSKGSDFVFQFGKVGLSVTLLGLLLFVILMIWIFKKYFQLDSKALLKFGSIKSYIDRNIPKKVSFLDIMLFLTILTSLYYMLFTKMHERYFHLGLIFGIIALASFRQEMKNKFLWFLILLICNISYFYNVLDVYYWWYRYDGAPSWVNEVRQIIGTPTGHSDNVLSSLTSVTNSICVLLMCVWVVVNGGTNYTKGE